jgi:hypothetical protein
VEQRPRLSMFPFGPLEPTQLKAEPSEHSRDRCSGGLPRLAIGQPRVTILLGRVAGLTFQPAPAQTALSTHCLLSLNGPTVIRSLEPCPCAPFAMHHASWCSYTDGCYT